MNNQHVHKESGPDSTNTEPSHLSHKKQKTNSLTCLVVTCSDTRTPDTDASGKLICQLLKEQGHTIEDYRVIKDEPEQISNLLHQAQVQKVTQVIIINGGTGIASRDSTFEAVDKCLEKRLDGFGELFRYLSYKDIGAPAMLSRATAGIYGNMAIFSIPGSQGAVRLAMEKLIIPEIRHIVGELSK